MPPENDAPRLDRDLLIKLDTQFSYMNETLQKFDRKMDDFNTRLESVVTDIKDDLKNDYVAKESFERLEESVKSLKKEIAENYVPYTRFEPVEEVYREISKRLRTMLITAGVCVLIAASAAPLIWTMYKNVAEIAQTAQAGVKR